MKESNDNENHSIAKGTATIEHKEYAKDNILVTQQNVEESFEPLNVGAVCVEYPYWLAAFLHTTFKITWICCKSRNKIALIKQHFPNVVVHFVDEVRNESLPNVTILVLNGDATIIEPRKLSCSYIFFDKRMRSSTGWEQWYFHCDKVKHCNVGGVTDFEGKFSIGIKAGLNLSLFQDKHWYLKAPKCNLHSILKCTNSGTECGAPPQHDDLDIVVLLGKNLIHHQGLLPAHNRNAIIITNSVFTSTKWCKRTLSLDELRLALDIPHQLRRINRKELLQWKIPVKVLQAIVNRVYLYNPVNTEPQAPLNIVAASPEEQPSLPKMWVPNVRHDKKETAATHDDAGVPVHLWLNNAAEDLGYSLTVAHVKAFHILRKWSVTLWKRSVVRCFLAWIK